MRSHIHLAATYLKHFASDPSRGRKSIVCVFNKKKQEVQNLAVENIGMKKGAFSNEVEQFNKSFEDDYNKFVDLMSIRYSQRSTEERLKHGMKMFFNLIFRNKLIYENIQRIYKNHPEIVEKYGEDPWQSSEVIATIFFELLIRRSYPILIKGFTDEVFITGDDPIIIHRLPFGTVFLLTIDRKHIFCLGYYDGGEYLKFMEYYINNFEIIPETINSRIRYQAETHYVI